MTKRFTHNGIVIVDHLKKDLIYIDGDENLLDLAEYVDRLQSENEQLKLQFNYIQNSISEHIKHQKTELGQKALKEIIEDYNEWLLGHKRLSR